MKKIFLSKPVKYTVSLSVLLAASFLIYFQYSKGQDVWKKIGLEIAGQNNIRVIDVTETKLKDIGLMELFGSFDGRYIKISKRQNMGKKERENYIIDEYIRTESLFQKKVLPYPGSISFSTESDERLIQLDGIFAVENKPVKYYLFYAEEGFRPCVYDVKKIKYRLLMFFLNNEEKESVYKI